METIEGIIGKIPVQSTERRAFPVWMHGRRVAINNRVKN
jgi:hypothetical protein